LIDHARVTPSWTSAAASPLIRPAAQVSLSRLQKKLNHHERPPPNAAGNCASLAIIFFDC